MSLLTDLRLSPTTAVVGENPWDLVANGLPLLVPGAESPKVSVLRGAVQVRGRVPHGGGWRYYLALLANDDDSARIARGDHVLPSLSGIGLPSESTDRVLRMGLSTARYEVDGNFYSSPFATWIRPAPGAVVVWMAGVLLTARRDWPEG